jgi:hypothetical protein
MNTLVTINNVLFLNVFIAGFWTVEFVTDFLNLFELSFGAKATAFTLLGWRMASCYALGILAVYLWALKQSEEIKISLVRWLAPAWLSFIFLLLVERNIYYSQAAWMAYLVSGVFGAAINFAAGFILPAETTVVPMNKSIAPDSAVEPSRVHQA